MLFLIAATLASLTIALVMSVVAWRVTRDQRRRSQARVEALAAEIRGEPFSLPQRAEIVDIDLPPSNTMGTDLFAATIPARGVSRTGAIFAAVVLLVGSAVAATVMGGRLDDAQPPIGATAPTTNAPLELVALGHEREGDRLTVRGVVRNPRGGAVVDNLTAIVLVFNHDGGVVGSRRAPIERLSLVPGAESGFVVALPGVQDIGRYRVSFRTDERVVPHVDRRDNRNDPLQGQVKP